MRLKRLFAACIAAVYFPLAASAIPADPKPKQVRQPDGTVLTILIRGDEHGHMLFTDDGVPLFRNSATGVLEYARLDGGALAGSGIAATDAGQRDAKARAYIDGMDIPAMKQALAKAPVAKRISSKPSRIRTSNFPTMGRQRCLVILMDFQNTQFTVSNPQQFFTDMLNEEGFTYDNGANGSVRDFYLASSFGKFDPQFDVAGPVTLSQPYSYYGQNANSIDIDINFAQAITEACNALDDEVDFSQYDADGDGFVDNIYFYYAGYGEADTGNADCIWPHTYYLYTGYGVSLTLDNVRIDRYSCGNELRGGTSMPTGIGTFVHEFGHVLGLADHYPTSEYGEMFALDPGEWDTMASGSYNDDMNTPPLFSGFERAELGWLDYTDLDLATDTISVLPNLGDSNVAYRVKVPGFDNEYFIMENRQQKGWDEYLPGHGMLLWHIDMDEDAWIGNSVNNDPLHQRVDIVEADGNGGTLSYSGDPFPGTQNIMSVDLKPWSGGTLASLGYINEVDGMIRILLKDVNYTLPSPENLQAVDVTADGFRLEWTDAVDPRSYRISVLKDNGQGGFTVLPGFDDITIEKSGSYEITGLEPSTTYRVELCSYLVGYISAPATLSVTTLSPDFDNASPTGLSAVDITPTGFTATWNEMEQADDYMISLTKHEYSEQNVSRGYDFSERGDGMPDQWETNSTQYNSSYGWYGEAAPALRMPSEGVYLIVSYPETRIDNLSLWCRSSVEGNKLRVEIDNGTGWNTLTTLDVPTTGSVLDVPVGQAGTLRLVFERTSGYIVIDDVYADCCDITRTPVSGYQDVSTGGKAAFTFESLEENGIYGFTVRGVNGDELSAVSAEYIVDLGEPSGITAPDASAEEGPTAVYDLQGRRMAEGSLPQGIYIVKKAGQPARKILVP